MSDLSLRQILQEDADECGRALVCWLAQQDPRTLSQKELNTLTPYRGLQPKATNASLSSGAAPYEPQLVQEAAPSASLPSAYAAFDAAAWHGQVGHACGSVYGRCPRPLQELREVLNARDLPEELL